MMREHLAQSQFDIVPNLREDWLKAKPYIIKALEHDDLYDIIDVECKIEDGTFLLWTGKQSAMVIEVLEFSQKKICNLLFCGGDLEELIDITDKIEIFCKEIGVSKLFGGGRKGWLRKLKNLGWKSEHLISKDL